MNNISSAAKKPVIISVAILVLVLLVGGYYYWQISQEEPPVTAGVAESKLSAETKKIVDQTGANIYKSLKADPSLEQSRDLQDLKQPSLVNIIVTEATANQVKGYSVFNKKEIFYFALTKATEIFLYHAPKLNINKTYEPAVYSRKSLADLKQGQRLSVRFDLLQKPYQAARIEILDKL